MSSDTVAACPYCDAANVHINSSRGPADTYYCKGCLSTFETPEIRKRERDPARSGLARKLGKIGEQRYPEKGSS